MSAVPGAGSGALPPQLTFRAVALAIVLAMILAAANTYLGLFAGMTIASAIPAAVVSMAVLRALGGGGILENNIVQTGASAGSSIASGVIFTIPALVILGYWQDFKYSWVWNWPKNTGRGLCPPSCVNMSNWPRKTNATC